ncbi:MAG: three-Cys-motif partner protein TcmP [Proteobacteria bacterium]|nr:three-Cys-motif partner protein TcmP [Pseudomonadota bacterium]
MAAPREIIWQLEPHSRAKHEILRRYLQAWMVILSQGRFPEILYIDGFAGPGEYSGGEIGSPIIALDIALGYRPPLETVIHFLFVEKEAERAAHLRELVARRTLPSNFRVIVEGGITFEDAFERRHSEYVRQGRLMPTFAFIDPFGWTGAPFSLVRKILEQKSCEVFVNFMYEEINRFIGHRDQVENFENFFGTNTWKSCVDLIDRRHRNRCLHDLCLGQLNNVARYVRSFEMSNSHDVTDYFLFYATNELLGLKKMKEAMWRVDESGEFRFSDATDPHQLVLFEKTPNLPTLQAHILANCSGRNIDVGEIESFVLVQTAFRESHYKGILKDLENKGRLRIVHGAAGRRIGTFGDAKLIVRID